jgi:formamidopyrimidine-DNA glycosylase
MRNAGPVTAGGLADRLKTTHRQIKSALLDQSIVACLGNLLVDEILWRARIDPP